MIKVGIVGATGYAGSELFRLLSSHKDVEIKKISSHSYVDQKYEDIFENFCKNELICEKESIEEMAEVCDVIFLALPHGIASKKITEKILEKVKIIDLGADFRFDDVEKYEEWYKTQHFSKELNQKATYGLCEINREEIKKSNIVANPGCYTTCSILSLYPLIKERIINIDEIIIDAKSGVSGAGRTVGLNIHYNEINENIKAYSIMKHRHTPEIEEQLSKVYKKEIVLTFTPHLIPMNRGILTTIYANLTERYCYDDIKKVYEKYYGNEYFIKMLKKGKIPETKWVKGSNFIHIGFDINERTNKITIIGVLDNLIKGAAGQAIQNMNLMFGLDENEGLKNYGTFPI